MVWGIGYNGNIEIKLKSILLVLLLQALMLLVAGCGGDNEPLPTYTPYPTYTPLPPSNTSS